MREEISLNCDNDVAFWHFLFLPFAQGGNWVLLWFSKTLFLQFVNLFGQPALTKVWVFPDFNILNTVAWLGFCNASYKASECLFQITSNKMNLFQARYWNISKMKVRKSSSVKAKDLNTSVNILIIYVNIFIPFRTNCSKNKVT